MIPYSTRRGTVLLHTALGAAIAAAACVTAPVTPEQALTEIRAEDLRSIVSVLAHDSMAGRETPSPQLVGAARYVGAELAATGLDPFFSDFLTTYPVEKTVLDSARTGVGLPDGRLLSFGRDVMLRGGATGAQGVTGSLVIVRGDPASGTTALDTLTVEESIVVLVLPGLDRGIGAAFWSAVTALPSSPLALLLVSQAPDSAWSARGRRILEPSYRLVGDTARTIPIFEVRPSALDPLLSARDVDLPEAMAQVEEPISVTTFQDITLRVRAPISVVQTMAAPIVAGRVEAALRGSSQAPVVLSAHLDHLGVDVEGNPYNGADDNASGVAALLEVARAFSRLNPRPERPTIFLFTSGEEKGLWGAESFADRLRSEGAMPMAVLNMDMLGRNAPDSIHLLEPEGTGIRELARAVATAHPDLGLTVAEDKWPEADFLSRSDQDVFLNRGVPAGFLFAGPHADYHQLSDDPELLDYDKLTRVTRLAFLTAVRMTRADWHPRAPDGG